jgi:uncharacterized protein DUF3489
MKHFTIDADNNIVVHATKKPARETSAEVFSTEKQFADLIGADNKRLVEIWNTLTGIKPVTKFANRKVATGRIWKALQTLGEAPAEEPVAADPTEASIDAQVPDAAPAEAPPTTKPARDKKAPRAPKVAKPAKTGSGPREGSKTAQVVAMLQRKNGATLSEIIGKMGWQKHTVRGFMAGAMKKAGYTVESFKPEGGERSYRINK